MVKYLYLLSQKSLIALIIFSLIITYYLYPTLHSDIVIWGSSVVLMAFIRLISVYYFKTHEDHYTLAQWHNTFIVFNLITAALISLLGILFLPQVNDMERLFITPIQIISAIHL
jgi:hypothetical protein